MPFEAAVLNLETGEWAQLGGPDAVYDVVDTFELGCVDRGVLAIPSEKPMFEQSSYLTHFPCGTSCNTAASQLRRLIKQGATKHMLLHHLGATMVLACALLVSP